MKSKACASQSQYFALACAHDIILRSKECSHPTKFHLMMARELDKSKLTRETADLLSAMRIAPSRKFNQQSLSRKIVEKMASEVDIGPLDFHVIHIDNIGFKDRGGSDPTKIGYRQYTNVIDMIIRYPTLKAMGLYSDDNSARLSREPNTSWLSLHQDPQATAARLVTITANDMRRLSECCLESMLIAIEDYCSGKYVAGSKVIRSARIINMETRAVLSLLCDISLVCLLFCTSIGFPFIQVVELRDCILNRLASVLDVPINHIVCDCVNQRRIVLYIRKNLRIIPTRIESMAHHGLLSYRTTKGCMNINVHIPITYSLEGEHQVVM
eukprot:scaffold20499_cov67-Cyclotella_meneghiniana.AAC.6